MLMFAAIVEWCWCECLEKIVLVGWVIVVNVDDVAMNGPSLDNKPQYTCTPLLERI